MTRFALTAVAALALVAAGCGGAQSASELWVESEPDFAQAAERTRSLPSYAYELRGDEFHLGDREEFVCEGWVDTVRPAARQVCEGGQVLDGDELRLVGDTSYDWSARRGKWREWPGVDLTTELSSTWPGSPIEYVELTASAQRVGEEVVRGERTVRYELAFDCSRMETCVEMDVEAWIDGDGFIRRVETFSEPHTTRWELFDFGVPVDVEKPSREEIAEQRDRAVVPCGSQPASPITVGEAIDTFRRHGFDIGPSEIECREDVVEHLVSRGDWDEVVRNSGSVICTVAADGWDLHPPDLDLYHHQAANYVENLGCQLAATGGRVPERVAAFEAALKELKRKHGP
jgi:hypothetical protein